MPLNERPPQSKPDTLADATEVTAPMSVRADDPAVVARIDALISELGGVPGTFDAKLVRELMQTALRLIPDGRDTGEIKLMTNAMKEMRYAYHIFGKYKEPHKVTIFGSARTAETHPDYTACVEFSKLMAEAGWMAITGAGGGIMQAGHVGPGRAASFGVAIRLPFEQNANMVIKGDEKLINFRYFFTRKLMFLSQAEAVVLFPGGFGTMDEAFETLTLVQTGKATPMPIVMVEGGDGSYWRAWDQWVRRELIDRGWVSPEDPNIYYLAKDPRDAASHIIRFYRNYHSSRYVKDDFVIRLRNPIAATDVAKLESEFGLLIKEGGMRLSGPLEGEDDNLTRPRLVFRHNRNKFAHLRRLIDRINELEPAV
ncbi:MAG: LOG family protein [Planctomycetes bacterium]|nr:LOG family protein [Planctomycetota bacterium]